MSTERQTDTGGLAFFAFLFLPILILCGLFQWLALQVARNRGSYNLIRLLCYPLTFVVTNMFTGFATWGISLVLATIGNWPMMPLPVLGDLTGWPIWMGFISLAFNWNAETPWTISPFWFILYQIGLYILVGHRILRQLAMATIDLSTTGREDRLLWLQHERGYLKDSDYYQCRGQVPILPGLITMARTDVVDYYRPYR